MPKLSTSQDIARGFCDDKETVGAACRKMCNETLQRHIIRLFKPMGGEKLMYGEK
jgi:hypothetical protein